MNREMRYCKMRYHGAPALDISMVPSSRSGVEPPPNSPRHSTDSRSTKPNTVDPGVMPTWSQADTVAREAAQELEATRAAVGWGHVDWVAAPASWRLHGLYGLVPVSLLNAVLRAPTCTARHRATPFTSAFRIKKRVTSSFRASGKYSGFAQQVTTSSVNRLGDADGADGLAVSFLVAVGRSVLRRCFRSAVPMHSSSMML
ncbi:hypothetical protein ACLKA7_001903 [Drosophila subpalustris]